MKSSIPQTIHYCWFGGKPLGPDELKCIESWKKFLPGYEIKRWDESNFDVHCCDYVSEAYEAGKWAFVSDYVRFDILYRYGGLYFDTDVEIIKPIDDLVQRGPFMGFEIDWCGSNDSTVAAGFGLAVNPGLGLAADKGNALYRKIIQSYRDNHFKKQNGDFDYTTVVTRVTKILLEDGLKRVSGTQEVDGIHIYPAEFFNPKSFLTGEICITDNTRSIHHFGMSWKNDKEKFEHAVESWLRKHGVRGGVAVKIAAIVTTIRYSDVHRIVTKIRKMADIRTQQSKSDAS